MSKELMGNHAPSAIAPVKNKESRLTHLDALKGIIMIFMALDHASYFIAHTHLSEFWGGCLCLNTSLLWPS
jgi:uncharacterized membrane protein